MIKNSCNEIELLDYEGYEFVTVLDVKHNDGFEPVFDVTIVDTKVDTDQVPHSIITNGIVTHNSSSNSMPYIRNILRTGGVNKTIDEVFGKKDPKTGKWLVPPVVRYSAETVGELFFDWLSAFLKRLPDKRYLANKWWYVYEDTKINKSKYGSYSDLSMAKKYGSGVYIEAEDGRMQGLVLTDSYPAMNPASNDGEDSDNSLALQARMFSKHLPRVKGRLFNKRVAVIGLNQIRAIPMARYGPTEQEPCGTALRFNSDVRNKFTGRALSGAPFNPKGLKTPEGRFDSTLESEPSTEVPGGFDTYRYIHIGNVKNKLSMPKRNGWIRLWTEDAKGLARGYDPVFDTIYYLQQTGQAIIKNRRSIQLNLNGLGLAKKSLNWQELKAWVLGDKKTMIAISTKCGYKPMGIRAFCFRQGPDSESLYTQYKGAAKAKKNEDVDDDDDNEDDD